MNCPYCGDDMEKGIIQSAQEIAWQRKRHILGAFWLHDGSVVLSPLSFFRGSAVAAYLCRECKKIVIDYSDISETTGREGLEDEA